MSAALKMVENLNSTLFVDPKNAIQWVSEYPTSPLFEKLETSPVADCLVFRSLSEY